MKQLYIFLLLTGPALTTSCKKLVEIPASTTSIASDNVFTNDASAIAVLTGIYASMSSPIGWFTGSGSITHFCALSADELTLYDGYWVDPHIRYYHNDLIMNNQSAYGAELWSPLFNYVFRCNAAIEGLTSPQAASLPVNIKNHLLGEAKFLRSFFYFYLINLFGKVPLVLTSDYKTNLLLNRSDEAQVYEQMVKDLQDAEALLNEAFLDETLLTPTTERIRPTKWAAKALLARVYLYQGNYVQSEQKATEVIDHTNLFSLTDLNSVYLKNSQEAIWQIQPTEAGFNTWEAVNYVLSPDGLNPGADRSTYLSPQLLNCFETGDLRRYGKWVDSIVLNGSLYYYSFKYKINLYNPDITSPGTMSEYLTVLRLAEQYLIRAEARARQDKLTGANSAQTDIDVIRQRAGLPGTSATAQTEILDVLLKERQTELFLEFGHRWLDLKRWVKVDEIMSIVTPLKGGNWQGTDKLYPLPLGDLQKAPNLEQNEGYRKQPITPRPSDSPSKILDDHKK